MRLGLAARRRFPHLLLIPLVLLWVYPFLWMVSAAFKSRGEMLLGGLSLIPDEPTLENFTRAWDVANFAQYTVNTVVFSIAVVAIVIAVSSTSGYALGRGKIPGRTLIVGALIVTMFVAKEYTIIPTFILIDVLGLNNSLAGVTLAQAGPAHVVAILLFMGYFAGLPRELEEAAIVDGASYPQIFGRIMFPLSAPVIGTVALFNFISAWNAFFYPLVFTLVAPELRTLGVGMYNFFGQHASDWTGLAAGACITIAPIVVIFLWLQKTFVEGVAGAIKG